MRTNYVMYHTIYELRCIRHRSDTNFVADLRNQTCSDSIFICECCSFVCRRQIILVSPICRQFVYTVFLEAGSVSSAVHRFRQLPKLKLRDNSIYTIEWTNCYSSYLLFFDAISRSYFVIYKYST